MQIFSYRFHNNFTFMYWMLHKLFKGRNCSRAETICRNTVFIHVSHDLQSDRELQFRVVNTYLACQVTYQLNIFSVNLILVNKSQSLIQILVLAVWSTQNYFFLKFRQSQSNPKRYLKEVICGYSVPLLFLIMTGIAESSLDQCSKYRPRFNEQSCFFSGIYDFKHWSELFRILLTCND